VWFYLGLMQGCHNETRPHIKSEQPKINQFQDEEFGYFRLPTEYTPMLQTFQPPLIAGP